MRSLVYFWPVIVLTVVVSTPDKGSADRFYQLIRWWHTSVEKAVRQKRACPACPECPKFDRTRQARTLEEAIENFPDLIATQIKEFDEEDKSSDSKASAESEGDTTEKPTVRSARPLGRGGLDGDAVPAAPVKRPVRGCRGKNCKKNCQAELVLRLRANRMIPTWSEMNKVRRKLGLQGVNPLYCPYRLMGSTPKRPVPRRGRRPAPGGGRRPAPGGGRRPAPGGGRRPAPGGGRRPAPGGGGRPAPGGGGRPEPMRVRIGGNSSELLTDTCSADLSNKAAKEWEKLSRLNTPRPPKAHRPKRQASTEIGESFKLSCLKRGDPETGADDWIVFCNMCWTWRRLPANYEPRYINELVCNGDDDGKCISGFGMCRQRSSQLDVQQNFGTDTNPDRRFVKISAGNCCDCKVRNGSPLHNFVAQ